MTRREELARLRWVAQEIARDAERDAHEFDGRPFDGRTVAEYFGNHGAAIKALADLADALLVEVHRLAYGESAPEPQEHPAPGGEVPADRVERP